MINCDNCGRNTEGFPFNCRRCHGRFCTYCRLPETHECRGLHRENVFKSAFKSEEEEKTDKAPIKSKSNNKRLLIFLLIVALIVVAFYINLVNQVKEVEQPVPAEISYKTSWDSLLTDYEKLKLLTGVGFSEDDARLYMGKSYNQLPSNVIQLLEGELTKQQVFEPSSDSTANQVSLIKSLKDALNSLIDDISKVDITKEINEKTESIKTTYEKTKKTTGIGKPEIDITQLEYRVHELINEQRTNHGLSKLDFDSTLTKVARDHSADMAANDYFEHINLRGMDPTARASAKGYSCHKDYGSYYIEGIAENIFQNNLYDLTTYVNGIPFHSWNTMEEIASSIVNGWMNSPGHRQNILTQTYDVEGIGVAIASNDKVYITEDFC